MLAPPPRGNPGSATERYSLNHPFVYRLFSKCNDLSFFTGKQPGGPSTLSCLNSNVQIAVESDAQQASKTSVIWLHPSLLTLQPRKAKLNARVLYQVHFQQLFTSIWSLSLYLLLPLREIRALHEGAFTLLSSIFGQSSELLYQLSSRFLNVQIHIVSSLYFKRFWSFDWSLFKETRPTFITWYIYDIDSSMYRMFFSSKSTVS